jgi:hypothetical protein
MQRCDICRLLIEKGADPAYKTPDGKSLQTYLNNTDSSYLKSDVTTGDLEFVKKTVAYEK